MIDPRFARRHVEDAAAEERVRRLGLRGGAAEQPRQRGPDGDRTEAERGVAQELRRSMRRSVGARARAVAGGSIMATPQPTCSFHTLAMRPPCTAGFGSPIGPPASRIAATHASRSGVEKAMPHRAGGRPGRDDLDERPRRRVKNAISGPDGPRGNARRLGGSPSTARQRVDRRVELGDRIDDVVDAVDEVRMHARLARRVARRACRPPRAAASPCSRRNPTRPRLRMHARHVRRRTSRSRQTGRTRATPTSRARRDAEPCEDGHRVRIGARCPRHVGRIRWRSVPYRPEDITTDWLSEATGSTVSCFEIEQIGIGVGLLGRLYRITLSGNERRRRAGERDREVPDAGRRRPHERRRAAALLREGGRVLPRHRAARRRSRRRRCSRPSSTRPAATSSCSSRTSATDACATRSPAVR